MSVSPLEALMAAGGATATEMADILINKHRVSTDYASEEKKDIKNDPALFGANQPIAMIKVSKIWFHQVIILQVLRRCVILAVHP